jgi:hypothetical protein
MVRNIVVDRFLTWSRSEIQIFFKKQIRFWNSKFCIFEGPLMLTWVLLTLLSQRDLWNFSWQSFSSMLSRVRNLDFMFLDFSYPNFWNLQSIWGGDNIDILDQIWSYGHIM